MNGSRVGDGRRQRRNYRRCKVCSVANTPDTPVSSRGKCGPCGEALVREAVSAMHSKSGPTWQRWAEGMLRAYTDSTGGRVMVVFDGQVQSGPSRANVA